MADHLDITISLDYEVFFGRQTGSVEDTLVGPTEVLCRLAAKHSVPLVFFVDVGYLLRIRDDSRKWPALARDYDRIIKQLVDLVALGHELQLHVHSHWEDSRWNGVEWQLDLSRYSLNAFGEADIEDIVTRYSNALKNLSSANHVFAYRAGGWVIQPFESMATPLRNEGILIDSTVFPGGRRSHQRFGYNFVDAPVHDYWRFELDPLIEDRGGSFLEVPIASYRVFPTFYWAYAIVRKLGGIKHKAFGNGEAVPNSKLDLMRMLLTPTVTVASIDGYKARFLTAAFEKYKRMGKKSFVVIGHPKALTPYSLDALDRFLLDNRSENFVGYRRYLEYARGS